MSLRVLYFNRASELEPNSSLQLHVPANEHGEILVHCSPTQAPQNLLIAIHVGISEIRVSREDQECVQVIDASPSPLADHLPNRAFDYPVESVGYRQVEPASELTDMPKNEWLYAGAREDIVNPSVFQTFSDLICQHAIRKQAHRRMADSSGEL